ncbi:universal stress protein [Catellatospora coxensis]|uniref:UspA domain-containing protein n=1 Tax=Catellatospora coxensis TaxID=310354 RepID=A0A8J3KYC6_9ACTN|nr:universal stress protein [Catellatospora coxensis]GIG05664.1 hypothetical protein Cco03nite_23640 [Catellatospora coxensis]
MTLSCTAIVVGVDGSPESDDALHWAASEAAVRGCGLRLLHAAYLPTLTGHESGTLSTATDQALVAAGRHLLAETMSALDRQTPNLPVTSEVRWGRPADVLAEAGAEAVMVVVGDRGRGGFASLLLGSTSLRTAMRAPCPVAVVRCGRQADPADDIGRGRVVVGVDGSARSAAAAMLAFEEAALHQADVNAVHVTAAPPREVSATLRWGEQERTDGEKLLDEATAAARLAHPTVSVDYTVVIGNPAATLIDQCVGARLAVVGTRGRGGFTGLLLGSVSQTLLHHASCPVLITGGHPPADDAAPDGGAADEGSSSV